MPLPSKPPGLQPKPKAPPPPPLRFGEPEKRNWSVLIAFWLFVITAIGLSVWLFQRSPKLHSLQCDNAGGMGSITAFGRCHEGDD
jgi:hypothetical protein